MQAPGALEVTRFPSVVTSVIVPVCVVSRCVFTSVAKCVLQRTHSVGARACVRATACMEETPCMDEAPRVPETLCVKETSCVDETPCVEATRV